MLKKRQACFVGSEDSIKLSKVLGIFHAENSSLGHQVQSSAYPGISNYTWTGGSAKTTLQVSEAKVGTTCTVDVIGEDHQVIGTGNCGSGGCTYRIKKDDLRFEESFMIREGSLFRIGFKVNPSKADKGIISWQEQIAKIAK